MDDVTTRAIVLGVNIFVTIIIVSLVVIMFFQMQDIYGVVYSTDTGIYSQFDDIYSMYNGRVVTGIGLLNAIKKYENITDGSVVIEYTGSYSVKQYVKNNNLREVTYLKSLMEKRNTYKYEDKYNVTVIDMSDGNTKIKFDRFIN